MILVFAFRSAKFDVGTSKCLTRIPFPHRFRYHYSYSLSLSSWFDAREFPACVRPDSDCNYASWKHLCLLYSTRNTIMTLSLIILLSLITIYQRTTILSLQSCFNDITKNYTSHSEILSDFSLQYPWENRLSHHISFPFVPRKCVYFPARSFLPFRFR